jgi:hypothetical protein
MIKQEIGGDKHISGVNVKVKCKRNKVAPPYREATFPVLFDYGIDDLGSMMSYLFGPTKKTCNWDGDTYKREDLANMFSKSRDAYEELINAVQAKWDDVERKLREHGRPPKF